MGVAEPAIPALEQQRPRAGLIEIGDQRLVVFEVEGPGFEALEKGTLDAFLAADQVGQAFIEEGASLRALDTVAFNEYASGFIDRSSGLEVGAFAAEVNEIVQRLLEDGTLKALSLEWFKTDYATPAADFDLETLDQNVE